jgi:hypothetical protein
MKMFSYAGYPLPIVSFFTQLHNLPPPEERKNDYKLGFRFKIAGEWLCSPPGNDFRPTILPEDESLNTHLLSFNKKYTRESGSVSARFEFTLKQNKIIKKDYKEFYETIQDLMKKWQWAVVFKKQSIDEKAKRLKPKLEENP